MSNKLAVGDEAPEFTAVDQEGNEVSLSQFKGKPVVLYFYPADFTPGCTKQACSMRDSYEAFVDAGAVVIGVSKDSTDSHKKFKAKYQLPFTLITDQNSEISKTYGVSASFFGLISGRTTFVINPEGKIELIFGSQLQIGTHIENALAAVKKITGKE